MAIPIIYRKSQEPAIASFDWVDIAEGTGMIVFYGIASKTSAAEDYHLVSSQVPYSNPIGTTTTSTGTTTIDFDLAPFNLPQTAKGTAYFSGCMGLNTGTITLKVQLKHYDGTTETNITSEIESQDLASEVPASEMVFLKLPLTTQKHFKTGEILRMTVKMVVATAGRAEIGHEPKNQVFLDINPGTKDTTVMALLMPFRIDL